MSPLENIYISPLELCNLSCLYCYTKKPKTILSNQQILDFVKKYRSILQSKSYDLKSIIFCGGEVFTLPNFTNLVNQLIDQNIFITIITNGTIDKLDEIKSPHNCQLIVSFDGPENIHDKNRGTGNFVKSKKFVKKALNLGFPVEIFYLITKDSYPYKDKLDIYNLHKTYLTDRLGSLSTKQVSEIRNNYPCYPPKDFGCNIFSLQSNGKFYGCCESTISIGSLSDPLEKVIEKYIKVITKHPLCYDPNYHCNLS
ncbi:MAG: radical SAM protein [bacterium]|nr:radical SAM protein [bacterium]